MSHVKRVVESVRVDIEGALHDPKRLLGVFGVEGGGEGDAGGDAIGGRVAPAV